MRGSGDGFDGQYEGHDEARQVKEDHRAYHPFGSGEQEDQQGPDDEPAEACW